VLANGAVVRRTTARLSRRFRMRPISTRVNEPENDDPSIVEPIELRRRPYVGPAEPIAVAKSS
jgi:hypothetical protein